MLGAISARVRGIFPPYERAAYPDASPRCLRDFPTFAFAQFSSSGLPDPRTKICHLSQLPQLQPPRHNIRLPPCSARDQHAQMKQLFSAPRVIDRRRFCTKDRTP